MKIKRGDTETITATAVNANGDDYSLVGLTVWFYAKSAFDIADGSGEIELVTGGSGVTVSGNVATATIAPTDTSGLPNRRTPLYYEWQVKDGVGAIYTLASGWLIVEPDIVRATS